MERAILQTEADRYVRVQYLAEGGMGAVYLGKKVGMGGFEKEVVLKQLLPEFTSQAHFIDLFIREAKLAASLDHANIVHTIDLVAAGRDYFIVMEYVRGADLRHITQRLKHSGQPLHPGAAVFIAREVLAALAYAHKKRSPEGKPLKLIHRDISPSNIMISGAGEVKLTDFGIAKASTHKSVFYRVKGKVGYMSPEQARGAPIDHRSDLYSVAVILHELLTGERLFVADLLSPPEAIYAQPIPRIGKPDGIDPLLRRGLAVEPNNRFQSASEFIESLVDLAIANDIAWTAGDLAAYLAATCGEDPARWSRWQQEETSAEDRGTEVLDDDDGFSGIELTSVLPPPRAPDGAEEATKRERIGPPVRPQRLVELPSEPTRRLDSPEQQADDDELTRQISYDGGQPLEVPPLEVPPPMETNFEDKATTIAPPHRRTGPRLPLDGRLERSADRSVDRSADRSGDRAARRRPSGVREHQSGDSWIEDAPTVDFKGAVPSDLDTLGEMVARQHRGDEPSVPPALVDRRASMPQPAMTDQMRQGRGRRDRVVMLAAGGGLLLVAIVIIIAVGMSGPTIEADGVGTTNERGATAAKPSDDRPAPETPERPAPPEPTPPPPPPAPASPKPSSAAAQPTPAPAPPAPPVKPPANSLRVESSPSRAHVYLDGIRQCRTPCTIEGLSRRATYLLSIRRKDYVSWSQLFSLRGKRNRSVRAYLSSEPDRREVGYLVVRSVPVADVHVDGAAIGRVSSEGRIPLPPGRHEVMLSHPKRRRKPRFTVAIRRQKTTRTRRIRF